MSYRKDQIKLLDLICSHMIPADFIENTVEVTVYEDELKQEGFSYNEAVNLIKEMYEVMPKLHSVTSPDNKRGFCVSANSSIYDLLKDLKYPNHEIEKDFYEDMQSGTFLAPAKTEIIIDSKRGIYRNDKPEYRYPLGSTTKRKKILSYLLTHERGGLADLKKLTGQEASVISQEIKRLNTSFREKLHLTHDLIIHIDTGGYCLNKEKFEIKNND